MTASPFAKRLADTQVHLLNKKHRDELAALIDAEMADISNYILWLFGKSDRRPTLNQIEQILADLTPQKEPRT